MTTLHDLAQLWETVADRAERCAPGTVDPDAAAGQLDCFRSQRARLERLIGGELPDSIRAAHERLCAAIARHCTN